MSLVGAHGEDRLLSVSQAARLAGVDPDTIRRWADRGLVSAKRTPSGHRRVSAASVRAAMAARRGVWVPADAHELAGRLSDVVNALVALDVDALDDDERQLLVDRLSGRFGAVGQLSDALRRLDSEAAAVTAAKLASGQLSSPPADSPASPPVARPSPDAGEGSLPSPSPSGLSPLFERLDRSIAASKERRGPISAAEARELLRRSSPPPQRSSRAADDDDGWLDDEGEG